MSERDENSPVPDEKETDLLLVAICGASALVRVRGRGSFKVAPPLKQFALTAAEQGCRQFVFDMDECIGMDSTFMGVLAGLALRLKPVAGGRVVVINLTSKTLALLETLGLSRLLQTHLAGQASEELRQCLADAVGISLLHASTSDAKLTLETMLMAHEDLVKAAPENLPKFKNVMTYLSADLKHFEGK